MCFAVLPPTALAVQPHTRSSFSWISLHFTHSHTLSSPSLPFLFLFLLFLFFPPIPNKSTTLFFREIFWSSILSSHSTITSPLVFYSSSLLKGYAFSYGSTRIYFIPLPCPPWCNTWAHSQVAKSDHKTNCILSFRISWLYSLSLSLLSSLSGFRRRRPHQPQLAI